MKKFFQVPIFALMASLAQAEIMTITSMKEVKTRVDDVLKSHKAEDIIVAFDIDMTLLQADHPAVW